MYTETKDNAISALKRPSLKGMQTPSDGASVDVDFTVPSAASNSNGQGSNEKRSESFVKSIRRWFHNADLGQSLVDIFICRCASCNPFSRRRNVGTQYRTIIPNHMLSKDSGPKHHPNRKYAGNKIKTTKYTLFTFLPKNLFEQFHRFANLYFVFVVLLNWFPQIEAFGKELAMIPVVFVLAVTAFKDLYEDRRRYRSDQKINHSVCRVFSTTEGRYVPTEWYNLIVGDIIHLSCNEIIPADVLLLRSSDPLGVCFVETSNLDGESNLKQRQIVSGLHDAQAHFKPTDFCSTIQCELPNNQIYRYNGFLLLPNGSREAVNKNNLLLRGCEIRNTDFVEGIVIYAGHETKAMLNNSGPRYKRTKLERMMNWDIVWCVVILLVLCFIGAVGSGIWLSSFEDLSGIVYLPHLHPNVSENRTFTTTPELEGFIVFWSYIIILQVMIPISLYVSIEIVKLGQVFFITQDRQLYHAASNKRIQCRALNIPEELGQIQYVMSDKTGTLTENQMIFRRCTVAGFDYGPPDVNISRDLSVANLTESAKETSKDVKPNAKLHDYISLISQNLDASASLSSPKRKTIMEFFVNMALCNTVVVNPHPHKDSMNANGLVSSTPGGDSTPSTTNTLMREIYPSAVLYGQPQSDYSTHSTPALPSRPMKNGLLPIINNSLPKVQSTENIFYVPPPSNNVSLPPLNDHSKNIPEIRTNLARRMSVSVPDLIGPDDDQNSVKNKHLSVGTDVGHPLFESTPELTESKEGKHTENGKLSSDHSLQWFPRPKTLNLNLHFSKFLELPRLAMQKFPLSRRSLLAPSISPGYKSPFYEAESPDELALVYASSAYGIRLVKRQGNFVTLEMPSGYLERYEVLYTLPFDSVRKRMSVVIRNPKTLQIVLFTKGADTAIMDILSDAFKESELGQTYLFKAQEYLNDYASKGYRTLCLAKRELSDEIFAKWVVQHIEAEMAIDDREQLIFESALRIEQELELLGITGIEDRLQDGVADCIKSLRQGGIRVWVLTGDKIETAVNIAYACELFVYGMDLIQLSARNEEDTSTLLDHHLNQLANRATNADDENVLPDKSESIGLVVDGRTLAYCLLPKMEDKFVQIVSRCTSVLCCRTSPLQKASVVRLVKDKLEGLTLAIGDGANDVSMIQCADVGVGISGQEGMQAVMASDFAMARFKFLKRLLLVHGHWCYDRLARMVCYFFYKNALFVFTLVWFQVWNGFSAQVMIDPLYLMLYNLVFTSLPPLLMGVFDQDAPDNLLIEKEILYAQGPKGLLYKSHSFWVNMLDALWQSVVIFFVPLFIFIDTDMTMWSFGFIITACLVVVNQCHLSMEVKSWTLPMLVSILLSVGVFVTFALCYNLLSITCCGNDPPYWVAERFMLQPIFWLCLLFVVVLSLLPRFTFRVWYNTVYPSDVLQACIDLREKQEKLKRNRTTVFNNLIARWITNERHVSFIQSGNAER